MTPPSQATSTPPQVVRATKMVQPVVDDYHVFSTKDLASWAVDLENLGQKKLTVNPCRTLWGRKTTNQPSQGRLPSSKRTWASNWKIHPSSVGAIHLHSWLDFQGLVQTTLTLLHPPLMAERIATNLVGPNRRPD